MSKFFEDRFSRRFVLSSATLLIAKMASQAKDTVVKSKNVSIEFKIIHPNIFKLTFTNSGSNPVNIWSPLCSLFWDSLILVCALKTGERTWKLWSEKGFTRNTPTTVTILPQKLFELDVDVDDDGWTAISQIADTQSKHGYECICVAEWDPSSTDEALRKKHDVHTKASSDRNLVKLALSGIY